MHDVVELELLRRVGNIVLILDCGHLAQDAYRILHLLAQILAFQIISHEILLLLSHAVLTYLSIQGPFQLLSLQSLLHGLVLCQLLLRSLLGCLVFSINKPIY